MKELLLKLKMIADNREFNRDVKQSNTLLNQFSDSAKGADTALDKHGNTIAATDAALGRFIDKQGRVREKNGAFAAGITATDQLLGQHRGSLKKTGGEVKKLGNEYSIAASVARGLGIAAGAASAGLAAGMAVSVKYGTELVQVNKELTYLSNQLEINKDALQVWGKAGESVGFSLEKVADIFKDFNDKAGDFAATGGGEAKEIFERLNLDVEKFIGLPADKKLLMIAGAFDELGDSISLEEKTFLLEAMGNDASRLLPLLENNAEKLREIEKISRESGAILSDEQLKKLDDANHNLQLVRLSANGLKNEIGELGADFLNAFGDDIANAIIGVTALVDQLAMQADVYSRSFLSSWEYASKGVAVAAGDSLLSVASAAEATENITGFLFDSIASGYADLPILAGAAYEMAVLHANAWLHENTAGYQAFKAATADALATVVDYAASGFAGMAGAGGSAIEFIINRLADLVNGIRSVASSLSGIAGFDIVAAGAANIESKLRGMAKEAGNAGSTVGASMAEAADNLRAYALETEKASIQNRKFAAESKLAAIEVAANASSQLELNKAQRQQAKLDHAEKIAKQTKALESQRSALDRLTEGGKRARINHEAINKSLGKSEKKTKKLTEAQKAAIKAQKERERAAQQLVDAQNQELNNLRMQQKQLELTGLGYYRATLQAKKFEKGVIDEATAIKYAITLKKEQVKLDNELAKNRTNPIQQYAQELKDQGLSNDDIQSLVEKKRLALHESISHELDRQLQLLGKSKEEQAVLKWQAEGLNESQVETNRLKLRELELGKKKQKTDENYRKITQEIDKQLQLLGATWEEQRRIELSAQNIVGIRADEIILSEKNLKLKKQELAAIDAIKGGLQSALQSAILGDGFDFDAIADGIEKSFKDRVFNAAFEADFSNTDSLSGLLEGFTGNSVGKNIAAYANQFGIQGFGNAGNHSNWQYGAASMAGGYAGEAMFGSGGSTGGQVGAGIGMAINGPVGAVVGTILGGLVGSIFGGEYEETGKGIQLAYVGGEVGGNTYTDSEKDGGWFSDDKKRRDYGKLPSALEESLNSYFDAVELSLVEQAGALKDLGIGLGENAAESIIDGFAGGAAESMQLSAEMAASGLLSGGGLFAGLFADMFSELTGVAKDELLLAQESFSEIDLTGKSEEEQKRLIDQWARDTQEKMYQAVFGADYDALANLARGAETSSEAVGRLIDQYANLNNVIEIVGGTFDAAGTEALEASDAIIQLFGGVEQFSNAASFYYENYFTEEERKAKALEQSKETTARLNEELNKLGYESINSREGLRDLIAGLDETSESGQKAYHIALQLARSFDVVADAEDEAARQAEQAARAADDLAKEQRRIAEEQAAMVASLRSDVSSLTAELFGSRWNPQERISAIQERISAEQSRIDDLNSEAMRRYDAELKNYEAMKSIASSISDYLNDLTLSDLSTLNPFDKLKEAQEQYNQTLKQAKRGDKEAAAKLTDAANKLLENAREYYASSDDYTGIFNTINADLSGVEAVIERMPEPAKPADVASLIIPSLERQIDAVNHQTEMLRRQDIAGQLKSKLEQLSLATGKDIGELAESFGVSIKALGDILAGKEKPKGIGGGAKGEKGEVPKLDGQPEGVSTGKYPTAPVATNSRYDLNNDGRMSLAEMLYQKRREGARYNKSYDVGSDYIQGDQVAQIHNAEMIFTAKQSGSIRDSVVSALQGLSVISQAVKPTGNDALLSKLIEEQKQIKQLLNVLIDNMNDNADSAELLKREALESLTAIVDNTSTQIKLKGAA